ncbi:PopZ family protein [Pseudochelatococcus sp. B33]
MSTASQRLYSVPREATRAEAPRTGAEPSMEEILASIRRIIADDQAHSEPLPGDGVSADAGVDVSAITFDDDVLNAAETGEDDAPAPPARNDAPRQAQPRQAAAPASPADREAPVPPEPAAAPPPTARSAGGEPQEPLLSSAADASAASAFQTLSSVVLSRSPRTLDDLVQDMLRPLLKAWLDEHLPPLVEKLVKAEIERISRNGR